MVFNRPSPTREVFDKIAAYQPEQLFIAADGPRDAFEDDEQRIRQVRQIVSAVNWDCEVKTLFREKNQGCKKAVSSAIDWFFEHVDEGIILEDDCLPAASFFGYCEQLLDRYRNESKVMMISGSGSKSESEDVQPSYYFSQFPQIWGWATWKTAWQHYDVTMKSLPADVKSGHLDQVIEDVDVRNFWLGYFIKTYSGQIGTWDYQWVYAILRNNGLVIRPQVNLIENIGMGSDGTHITSYQPHMSRKTRELDRIFHPEKLAVDRKADMDELNTLYQIKWRSQKRLFKAWNRSRLRKKRFARSLKWLLKQDF